MHFVANQCQEVHHLASWLWKSVLWLWLPWGWSSDAIFPAECHSSHGSQVERALLWHLGSHQWSATGDCARDGILEQCQSQHIQLQCNQAFSVQMQRALNSARRTLVSEEIQQGGFEQSRSIRTYRSDACMFRFETFRRIWIAFISQFHVASHMTLILHVSVHWGENLIFMHPCPWIHFVTSAQQIHAR